MLRRAQHSRTSEERAWLGDLTLELAAEAEGEESGLAETSLLEEGTEWRDQFLDVLSRDEDATLPRERACRPTPDADDEWLERQRRVAAYQLRVARFGSIWEPAWSAKQPRSA